MPATQVVAIKHARRSKDETKYPVLEQFNHVYNSHGDAEAYLQAEPTEALQYILDDFALAMNIMDKTADGLALLVSAICQAAVQEVTGDLSASERDPGGLTQSAHAGVHAFRLLGVAAQQQSSKACLSGTPLEGISIRHQRKHTLV